MLNSRDINLLRPDVAANCRLFLGECAAAGHNVKITGTVRDDEFQMQCYRKGTGGRPPATFHSVKAGLAFDIVKELPGGGIDYNDAKFWREVGQIGKRIGFTWGGDWKRVDKPHFQWDAHGKFTGSNILAGKMPPQMPLYKEVEDMTEQQVKAIVEKVLTERDEAIAQANAKIAKWSADAWNEAKQAGLFDGTRPGAPLTRQEAAILCKRLGLIGGRE